jgi:3-hydroxymyristoyl/3-hydroxydecanoyl-(acyl carrier protein) dehydratase
MRYEHVSIDCVTHVDAPVRLPSTEIVRRLRPASQSFRVSCTTASGEAVFTLETVFGFFPPAAFAEQPGLPPSAADVARLVSPGAAPVELHSGRLGMLDRVTGYVADGGRHGLGWLRAEKDVDAGDWYFKAHFLSDPVQPGSLGVQALASLLEWYLTRRGPGGTASTLTGHPVTWKYRGQVVPTDGRVTVELDITGYGSDGQGTWATADGWLWVDGRRIYHVTNLGLRLAA